MYYWLDGRAKITNFQKIAQKLSPFGKYFFSLHRFFEKQEYRSLFQNVSLQKSSRGEVGKKILQITYKPISYIFRKLCPGALWRFVVATMAGAYDRYCLTGCV